MIIQITQCLIIDSGLTMIILQGLMIFQINIEVKKNLFELEK